MQGLLFFNRTEKHFISNNNRKNVVAYRVCIKSLCLKFFLVIRASAQEKVLAT